MNAPVHPKPDLADPAALPPKSHGEKRFDRWVYGGLNTVGTFVLTLPLAYWAKHGRGAQFFEESQWFKKLETALVKHTPLTAPSVKEAMNTTVLGLGGTVTIPFVRIAEAYRKPLVNWLSQGTEDKITANEHLREVPPQTWGSLLLGRGTAWLAVFSSLMGADYVAKKIVNKEEGLNAFEKWFAQTAINKPLRLMGLKEVAEDAKAFKYGRIAALDIFATAGAGFLLYIGSRFFARHSIKGHEIQEKYHTVENALPTALPQADGTPAADMMPAPAPTVHGEKSLEGALAQHLQAQTL